MNTEQRISKIENLDNSGFAELVEKLILKMGYSDIQHFDSLILASFKGPMSTDHHGFIFFDEQLSGNVDVVLATEKIIDIKATYTFSTSFIVSNYHISKGFKDSIAQNLKIPYSFLDRDDIIGKIEVFIPDFWKHDDMQLLDYERNYCDSILKESELKSLKIFSDKYQKLLNIFIEPKIVHYDEENETQTPTRKAITLDHIVNEKKPIIIAGDAGMGKSTLLKRIGEIIINKNQDVEKKNLPVFISVTELYNAEYDLGKVLIGKLAPFFPATSIDDLGTDYDITLLIDSIDELELEHQEKIVNQLNNLFETKKIRFILATRSTEKSVSIDKLKKYHTYNIARFNNQQIELFINKFFFNQSSRAEKLLEALRENRIIEKLPITPLSLSLISILYEENDLEIPATITDIYDNFNSLLLGKAVVTSRIEFIDISFKERILSLYALEILKRKEHNPMTMDEFMAHFTSYFESKTIPLKKGTLKEVLEYLVENTGIIYLKNNTYVAFNHDSFMEYYAAVEIFKHQRAEEQSYVDHFFDINWQNSAVFYAGHSKDMPLFLSAVNDKIKNAKLLNEYFSAINGGGYLLQALFQTDNKLRQETVELALENNIRALELFIKLASDDGQMFKSYKLPIIWLMNLLFFHENFNSGTLKEPLKLAFASIIKKYIGDSANTTNGYKALTLALTLNSNRINEQGELEELIFKTPILSDNILTIISEISLEIMSKGSTTEIKKEVKKEFKKIKAPLKHLLQTPANKLRFSAYDTISSSKRVKIVTEGKTDASIIEHAYMTLLNGESPYWKIKPAGNDSGSAHEVNKVLVSAKGTIQEDEIVIGIFDHDDEGIKEFNMLPEKVFNSIKNNTVRKHKHANIYAILLPIPGEKSNYLLKEQKYNYFEIEHYFPLEFLKENDALKETLLTESKGIYSIKDGKKSIIMKKSGESSDPKLFKDFILLFEEIDNITTANISYE
jgi:hypothetical protein